MLSFNLKTTLTSQISHIIRTHLKDKFKNMILMFTQFFVRKRAVLFAFKKAGSLTVEAAFVVPVFFLAVMSVLSFMQVIIIQMKFIGPISNTAREMAQYVYLKEEYVEDNRVLQSLPGKLVTKGLSVAVAKNNVVEEIGEEWIDNSAIVDGVDGLSFLFSQIPDEENMVDLVVHYRVQLDIGLFKIPSISITQRCCVRGWVGNENRKTAGKAAEKVYITDTGKVYHKSLSCTHIQLSIQQVYLEDVAALRNEAGGKYYPCETCGDKATIIAFITDTGNRYHTSLSCKGVKRGIKKVSINEVGARTPCKRCGNEE